MVRRVEGQDGYLLDGGAGKDEEFSGKLGLPLGWGRRPKGMHG